MTEESDQAAAFAASGLTPTKFEVSQRLGTVYDRLLDLGDRAAAAGIWKDSLVSFQLAGNIALTIASIKDQPDGPQNDLSAGVTFEDDE